MKGSGQTCWLADCDCFSAVTHGHIDHVGALASLLKAYPDLQVIFHEKEAPFLTGAS